jgi:uridylate kinase
MNCLALADVLEQMTSRQVQTALESRPWPSRNPAQADKHLKNGRVVIFAAALLPVFLDRYGRRSEGRRDRSDVILLAKRTLTAFTAQTQNGPLRRSKSIRFLMTTCWARKLAVMDSTATSLSMDNHIPSYSSRSKTPKTFSAWLPAKKSAPS